jgi:MFS family permease
MSGQPALPFRTLLLLYLAIIGIGTGQTVVFAILPMLGRELEIDQLIVSLPWLGIHYAPKEQAITALTALTSLAFFFGAPYWGRRSDSMGRKPVIIIGLLGYALGTYLFNGIAQMGLVGVLAGFTLYAVFIVSRIGLVLLMSAALPATSAYIVDATSLAQRTSSLSKLAAASQIGTMVGPAFAWFVIYGFLAPLYIQATMTLIIGIAVWIWLPESSRQFDSKRKVKKLRFLDPRYRQFLLIGLVIYTMVGMVQMTLGFYFEDRLGLSREAAAMQFSIALVASSIAMLCAQVFVVQRWRGHPIRLLQFGLPFVIAGYLCIANATNEHLLWAGMALIGLGMGMATPGFSVSATFTVNADEQGGLAGLNSSAPALGFVFGPLLGGYIYKSSPDLTYWVAACVLIPLWFYVLRMKIPLPGDNN